MATFYSPEIPSPGTSAHLRIKLDVTAAIHYEDGDATGWDVTLDLYLQATAAGGYPNRANVDTTGSAKSGGSTRVSYGPTGYAYGSPGSPLYDGQLIALGSASYFIPVTDSGDYTLTGIRGYFTGGGGTPLGSSTTFNTAGVESGTEGDASLILPHIDRGALDRYNGSTWPIQNLERFDGSVWKLEILERWNGSAWVRQI